MKKNAKTLIYIISSFILIAACHTKKNVVNDNKIVDIDDNRRGVELKTLMIKDSLEVNNYDFNSLSVNFSGNYNSNEQNLPLKGVLRIKKGSFIWVSIRPALSVEIGRLLLTNDSIKYIDRLKEEYFIEDYSYINKKFGLQLNYKIFESILTNSLFTYPPDNTIDDYFVVKQEGVTKSINATGIYSGHNLSHTITFNSNNWFIIQNILKILDLNRELNLKYESFQMLYDHKFPKTLNLKLKDIEKNISMFIEYNSVDENKIFEQNFKIPDNYKRITFE